MPRSGGQSLARSSDTSYTRRCRPSRPYKGGVGVTRAKPPGVVGRTEPGLLPSGLRAFAHGAAANREEKMGIESPLGRSLTWRRISSFPSPLL